MLINLQGFDEFMNLVIDDAVEVKLATKEDEESRRQLGWFQSYNLQRTVLMWLH